MLLLNGGVGECTWLWLLDGSAKTCFANVRILNHATEVHTTGLYHIFKKCIKKEQFVPKRRLKRHIYTWSVKCGETLLMNFAMLSTLIGKLMKLLAHATNLKRWKFYAYVRILRMFNMFCVKKDSQQVHIG